MVSSGHLYSYLYLLLCRVLLPLSLTIDSSLHSIVGHPALTLILGLGGKLTLRSNWKIYCQEMVTALRAVNDAHVLPGFSCSVNDAVQIAPEDPMTHFERKFLAANIPVYEVTANLGMRGRSERLAMMT